MQEFMSIQAIAVAAYGTLFDAYLIGTFAENGEAK
jgi:hypothetical protein